MYESHFGLSGPPFQLIPDPTFYFGSRGHTNALAFLKFGAHQGEGFLVVTGEIGAGKTTLVRTLLEGLDPKSVVAATVVSTQLEPGDLPLAILMAFGVPTTGDNKAQLVTQLEAFLTELSTSGRRALLIVDEAQNLAPEVIEELRLLTNFQLGRNAMLQVFLVGQPELRGLLQSRAMDQLRQRVTASCHLGPLDPAETRAYVQHRLKHVGWNDKPRIELDAFQQLHRWTGGIPRRINRLCNRLLLAAFLETKEAITPEDVEQIAQDLRTEIGETDEIPPPLNPATSEQKPAQVRIDRIETTGAAGRVTATPQPDAEQQSLTQRRAATAPTAAEVGSTASAAVPAQPASPVAPPLTIQLRSVVEENRRAAAPAAPNLGRTSDLDRPAQLPLPTPVDQRPTAELISPPTPTDDVQSEVVALAVGSGSGARNDVPAKLGSSTDQPEAGSGEPKVAVPPSMDLAGRGSPERANARTAAPAPAAAPVSGATSVQANASEAAPPSSEAASPEPAEAATGNKRRKSGSSWLEAFGFKRRSDPPASSPAARQGPVSTPASLPPAERRIEPTLPARSALSEQSSRISATPAIQPSSQAPEVTDKRTPATESPAPTLGAAQVLPQPKTSVVQPIGRKHVDGVGDALPPVSEPVDSGSMPLAARRDGRSDRMARTHQSDDGAPVAGPFICLVDSVADLVRARALSKYMSGHPGLPDVKIVHAGNAEDLMLGDGLDGLMPGNAADEYLGIDERGGAKASASALIRFETVLRISQPQAVLSMGTSNSVLACSLLAHKSGVPLLRHDAGRRRAWSWSGEEMNAQLIERFADIDYISDLATYVVLLRTGITADHVLCVGDLVGNVIHYAGEHTMQPEEVLRRAKVSAEPLKHAAGYVLATTQIQPRSEPRKHAESLANRMVQVGKQMPVLWSVNAYTLAQLRAAGLEAALHAANVILLPALGYLDCLDLLRRAKCLVAGSTGDYVDEAVLLGVATVVVGKDIVIPVKQSDAVQASVSHGVDKLERVIIEMVAHLPPRRVEPEVWDGGTAKQIAHHLESWLPKQRRLKARQAPPPAPLRALSS
jgi:putative secretion ATPase (PEP-CTERM system associated)